MKNYYYILTILLGLTSMALAEPSSELILSGGQTLRESANPEFFKTAKIGTTVEELLPFIHSHFHKKPTRVTGEYIRAIPETEKDVFFWDEDQIRALKDVVRPHKGYWLVSTQGPISSQEMYLIFSGKELLSSKLIFRDIIARKCI